MPKMIDMTGEKYGLLTVMQRDCSKIKGTYWLCKCQCGNICSARRDQLTSGKKTSCGCDVALKNSTAHLKNEVGNIYGYLTVIKRVDNLENTKGARWLCQCKCGNFCKVRGINLRNGSVQSCGCKKFESHNGIDETGKRYGKLLVLKRSDRTDGSHIFWHCQCDCGNTCDVNGTYLRQGISTNCGCEKSVGEARIASLLKENNILFKKEYTFPDLLGDRGHRLRFDFAILNSDNSLQYLIEYDGIQHFQPACFGQDDEAFLLLKKYDKIKNDYCKKHNIKLIRIPYTKLKTLSIQDLL